MRKTVDDYKDVFGMWRKHRQIDGRACHTKSGSKWCDMLNRCKVGGVVQKANPTYIGCTASENFNDFQYFTEWHTSAVGYSEVGRHLDKDILASGNKIYSEDNCVLVPQALNLFLVNRVNHRGEFPQGVGYIQHTGKFRARVNVSGKGTYLGYFTTPEAAYEVYKEAKEAEAYRWYERLKAGEFIVDERVIERMRVWKLEE